LIGTTTSGEILEDKILNNSTVLSISIFEATEIKTALFNSHPEVDSFKIGVTIANALVSNNSKVLILFSDGLNTNGEELLNGINSISPQIIVAGGRAADHGYMHDTLIFTDTKISNNGVVGAVLNNEQLYVLNLESLCWHPIGKKMTVTHAINERIYTIDDIPIQKIYEKYLGNEISYNLPKSATEFPFVIDRAEMRIARVVFGKNSDDSLNFIGNIYPGEKVHFSFGDYEELLKKSQEIINKILSNPVESIFIYSCTARRVFFQEKIKNELIPLSKIASCTGFFTYGEFFHTKNRNELLNLSTTILVLSEGKSYKSLSNDLTLKKQIENFVEDKQDLIIDVLTHLSNTVTAELEEINKSILRKNSEYKQLVSEYNKKNLELLSSNKKLKEQQSMLIQLERLSSIGQLIGSIAHNLQTPLMASGGAIWELQKNTLLLKDLINLLPENKKEQAQSIISEMLEWQLTIKTYLVYISDLINTVKSQIRYVKNNDSVFAISELLDKLKMLLDYEVKRRKSSLVFVINLHQEIFVKGEINILLQVLNNIIINAVESYDEKGGKVELCLRRQEIYLEIRIRDYGKGIDKKIAKKIFREMVTTKGKNGSGLGLYISYLIIKTQFFGNLYFKNNLDQGTTFYILIPSISSERSDKTNGE